MANRKSTKNLLMAVLYDAVEPYLYEFFKAISRQDTEDYDLLLLIDGYTGNFEKYNPKRSQVILNNENKNPAEIRQIGINYAISNGYDNLIFSDADDYFSNNRIRLSIEWLNIYDFVYNDLILIDNNSNIISETYSSDITTPPVVYDLDTIIDYNIFGLTHTAVRVDKFENIEIPKDQLAVDWYIFSLLLLNGAIGKRLSKNYTYYRQYKDSYVGALPHVNRKIIDRGVTVKCNHYEGIVKYINNNKMSGYLAKYKEKLDEVYELERWLQNYPNLITYMDYIKKHYSEIYRGWWSEIITLKQLEKHNEFLSKVN